MTGIAEGAVIAGYIGAAAAVAGAGIAIYSAISTAQNQAEAAKAQSKSLETEAESARAAAAFEEASYRRRAAFLLSKQQAIGAASGLDITTGSPLAQELDNVTQAELEAINIRTSGSITASGREFESRMARYRGTYASGQIPGLAATGALKIGGSVLSSWTKSSGYANQYNVGGI